MSKPKPKPPKSRLQIQSDERLSLAKYDLVKTIGGKLVLVGGSVAFAYFGMESIKALAGKETNAVFDLFAKGALKLSADRWIAYTVASLASVWAYRERKLRQRVIKRYAPLKSAEEKFSDPNRTSSRLGPTGQTRREDE